MGGVVWFPLILLEFVLGVLVGGTRAWTPIYVSLIVIGVVTGGTFWVLGGPGQSGWPVLGAGRARLARRPGAWSA